MDAGKADAKLSVITVTKDDPAGLTRTLKSVVQQDYPKMELVVADGGESLDGSDEFREFGHWVDKWISEPDHGIFDAMNKGLALATGDWVIFMNSGDVFSSGVVLSELAGFIEKEGDSGVGRAGVIYGDSIADYGRFRVYRPAGQPADLWKGMICNHQSMLFRRETLLTLADGRDSSGHPAWYDTTFRISADHDLVCRLHRAGVIFKQVPLPVSVWETRGVSNRMQVRSVAERYRVIGTCYKRGLKVKLYYLWLLILAVTVRAMYFALPQKLLDALIRIANRKSLVNQ